MTDGAPPTYRPERIQVPHLDLDRADAFGTPDPWYKAVEALLGAEPPVLSSAFAGLVDDYDVLVARGTLFTEYGYSATSMFVSTARAVTFETLETGSGVRIWQWVRQILPPMRTTNAIGSDKVLLVDERYAWRMGTSRDGQIGYVDPKAKVHILNPEAAIVINSGS